VSRMIELLDTTLRDGSQAAGISLSQRDRQSVLDVMDELGIPLTEAGSFSPAEAFFLNEAKAQETKLVAFGMTRRPGISPEEDERLRALAESDVSVVSLVGKADAAQTVTVLGVSRKENLSMIRDSVQMLVRAGKRVIFDAEHFFDGFYHDREYAMACLSAAEEADTLCLCDTKGGRLPEEVRGAVTAVRAAFPDKKLGIHAHDDCGMAVACSLAAVEAGCVHVQGTLLGLGERCGNANLATLAGLFTLKLGLDVLPVGRLSRLTHACRKLAGILNIPLPGNAPFVGINAFTHKAGMHIDGVLKEPSAFEQIAPSAVGNTRRLLASQQAGKALIWSMTRDRWPQLDKNDPDIRSLAELLKEKEEQGYRYEDADASLKLILHRELDHPQEYFTLEEFKIITDRTLGEQQTNRAVAVIKLSVGGNSALVAAEGDGPVHAMDIALRQALERFYPELMQVKLLDYKVHVIDSSSGSAARVQVAIQSGDSEKTWNTVGVSTDIIDASWQALVDSLAYKLMEEKL
jgi:2-isopropylmalate synthase